MGKRTSLVVAVAIGAGLQYLLDPDRGRARRSRLADQAAARARRGRHRMSRTARDQRNRWQGRRYEHHRVPTGGPLDDHDLVQKVRSEVVGRWPFRAWDVSVDAAGGVVHLRGSVPAAVAHRLVQAVAAVEGVRQVDNLLHLPGEPAPNKVEALMASDLGHRPPRRTTAESSESAGDPSPAGAHPGGLRR